MPINVIEFQGDPKLLAWKYPNDEIKMFSQLTVHNSQEAIFVKDGQVCDIFGPGRFTLETNNLPILSSLINLPFGGRSPFRAQVWFINQNNVMDIKWGTPSPVQVEDSRFHIFVPLRARGSFEIRVSNTETFVRTIVGIHKMISPETLSTYFRGIMVSKIKDALSKYIMKKQVSIVEINSYLLELSSEMKTYMNNIFLDYGIQIVRFNIEDISFPEDDPSVIKVKDALAKRAEMDIVGYNYQEERSYDVLEKNSGNSAYNTGLDMSIGMAMGKMMADRVYGTINQSNDQTKCPKCSNPVSEKQKYCSNCGYDLINQTSSINFTEFKCNSCNSQLISIGNYCYECGRKLNRCSNCGYDIPDAAMFCPKCGKSKQSVCPCCGIEVHPDAMFCYKCGTKLK